MRLFLALRVPSFDIPQDKLTKLKNNLEKFRPHWIPKEQLYIPLVELGDHGRGSFLRLYELVKTVSYDVLPFDLKFSGLWAHPRQESADMLWVDVQNSRSLRSLVTYLSQKLSIPEDEFLRPHLPLLHLERERNVTDVISPFKNFDFGSVNIHEILFLEKLPGLAGTHMVGSHLLHGQDVSGIGLS